MPYAKKPQFPAIAQANVGDTVTIEGVKVAYMFDLAQGKGWVRQDMKVASTDGTWETKVKYWRPERTLNVGDIVTVVGKVEEYNSEKSLSVDSGKGGGIAMDGEPLAHVAPRTSQPAPRHEPVPERKSFLISYYERVLAKFDKIHGPERHADATTATHSTMIAYYRSDISEEELERWLDEEDVPW